MNNGMNIIDRVIKYGLYLVVFLTPLFFLPLTSWQVAQNKQTFLAVLILLLLILWLAKIIVSGRFSFVWSKTTGAVALLLLVMGISTFFSGARLQSFWGMGFEADTMFSFLLYGLVFFLFSNLVSRESVASVIWVFLASSGALAAFFIIEVFSLGFGSNPWFNPVGSPQALSVFLGGAFVVLLALVAKGGFPVVVIQGKEVLKKAVWALIGALGVLLVLVLLLVGFWAAWLAVAFGVALVVFSQLRKLSVGNQSTPLGNPLKPVFLPMVVFAVAIVLVFVASPFVNFLQVPSEVSLNYQASFNIAKETLEEGPKELLLGSGPATFSYQYSLHQGGLLNLSEFWQLRFTQGTSVIVTLLATMGVLGILAVLLLIAAFFWQGFRNFSPLFVGGLYFFFSWFLYPSVLSLFFATFLFLGLQAATLERKEFLFSQSPQKAFFIMLLGIIFIVASTFGIWEVSQKYIAGLEYEKGVGLLGAEEPKLAEGIGHLSKAATLDEKDWYFGNLSQAFLLQINEALTDPELSQEEMEVVFQVAVSNAEMAAAVAIQLNPKNRQNWIQLGTLYENFASINMEGALQGAKENYIKAGEVDPFNPFIALSIGRIYKTAADRQKTQLAQLGQTGAIDQKEAEEKLQKAYEENLQSALEQFQKAIELKANFAPAYFIMAQVQEAQGKNEEALVNYEIVLQLDPGNEEVKNKVEELAK